MQTNPPQVSEVKCTVTRLSRLKTFLDNPQFVLAASYAKMTYLSLFLHVFQAL
jgi:hypothetical protein